MTPTMTSRPVLVLLAAVSLALVGCESAPPPPPTTVPAVDVRAMTFPVEGEVSFVDSFGAPRSGGRTHQGTDIMAPKMARALAAADGTVTRLRHTDTGTAGNSLTIVDDDGWSYVYLHLNNDTPGTDDGANRFDEAFVAELRVGSRVRAGQHVAFVGDSGNAENTGAHLHFELHDPDGRILNPYPSLVK